MWEVKTEERQNIWGTEVLELHSSNPNNREHILLVSDHQTELLALRVTQGGASSPYRPLAPLPQHHTHTEMFLVDSKSFRLFIGNTEKQIDGEISFLMKHHLHVCMCMREHFVLRYLGYESWWGEDLKNSVWWQNSQHAPVGVNYRTPYEECSSRNLMTRQDWNSPETVFEISVQN